MGWDSMLFIHAMFMNLLMAPALFALVSGFVVAREYQDNTINTLLTYPVPRVNLLLGKLVILLPVICGSPAGQSRHSSPLFRSRSASV